jgi:hypothetical protein
MKSLRYLIAAAALAFTMPAQVTVPAQAAVGGPEVIIYRVSGVVDDNNVLATSFHCTNFSGVTETVRVAVRALNGALVANVPVNVAHLSTTILSTHDVFIYGDISMATGAIVGGTAAIAATSVNVTCTAMQIQTNVTNPVGIALHMTRFNPISATEE